MEILASRVTFALQDLDEELAKEDLALSAELVSSAYMYAIGMAWRDKEHREWEDESMEKILLEECR